VSAERTQGIERFGGGFREDDEGLYGGGWGEEGGGEGERRFSEEKK